MDESKNPSLPTSHLNSKLIPVPFQNSSCFHFDAYTSGNFCVTYILIKYIILRGIKLIMHCSRTCFFHCVTWLRFKHINPAYFFFLSYSVWMCHAGFAIPQVTFKLALICDHCRQCCTAHSYIHMQIFLWDRDQELETRGMICTF